VSNAASSAASALFNAGGKSIGGILASNRASSLTRAFIEFTGPRGAIVAGEGVSLRADDTGLALLDLGITLGDLTEGFALIPTGFDTVAFTGSQVQITPEPSTCLLFGSGLAVLARRRRVSAT